MESIGLEFGYEWVGVTVGVTVEFFTYVRGYGK